MTEIPTRTLAGSGYTATITPDRWVAGAYTLTVDGTPQSHVNLDDPTQLFFEYVQRMGHVIDQIGEPANRSPPCTSAPARSPSRATWRRPGLAPGSR